MNSKLTAEGIMGAAMRMGTELSGGEFPISVFPHKIQRIITELHSSGVRGQTKANYNDLISDFNLYLCERYGYRNACSVMWNENGICISIHRGSLDIYIRFWEYSKGVGNFPDWSIIIARCEFRDELRENRFELLKDLVRFFKEYMPRYGYKHLCTEDDDYKYYQTLNLPCIKRGFMGRHCNYGAPLKDVNV